MPELITEQVVAWLMTPAVMEEFPPLEDLAHRPAWMKDAQCRGEGTELFLPSVGGSGAKARALCAECSVRAECLSYALADPELAGIWAGTSVRDRRKLRGMA